MTSLYSLANLSDNRECWIDSSGSPIATNQLMHFAAKNRKFFTDAKNKNVAIFESDRSHTVQLLCLLDGLCSQLFIVPPGLDSDVLVELLNQAKVDVLVSDREVAGLSKSIAKVKLVYGGYDTSEIEPLDVIPIETEWIIATSGTTGVPKLLVHSLENLSGGLVKNLSQGDEFVWGLVYDLSKYAGLQVYLQSLIGGSTLLLPSDEMSLTEQINFFSDYNCNALSATPTLWRKILMSPACENLQLKRITLGGEIADQSILDELAKRFPKAKIVHIYASTEAGVGFSVRDGFAGFPASYLTAAPRDVFIKVVDGRLFLKSSNTSKSILNLKSLKDDDGYIDTGDLVELKDDRYCFLGRASGLINVGGNKVYPEEVEQVLLLHDKISLARVYKKENHLMGNLVVCDLVVSNGDIGSLISLKKEIRTHCLRYLADWKVPVLFNFVESIDNSSSGKQIRK